MLQKIENREDYNKNLDKFLEYGMLSTKKFSHHSQVEEDLNKNILNLIAELKLSQLKKDLSNFLEELKKLFKVTEIVEARLASLKKTQKSLKRNTIILSSEDISDDYDKKSGFSVCKVRFREKDKSLIYSLCSKYESLVREKSSISIVERSLKDFADKIDDFFANY